jgi:hypothetical protein
MSLKKTIAKPREQSPQCGSLTLETVVLTTSSPTIIALRLDYLLTIKALTLFLRTLIKIKLQILYGFILSKIRFRTRPLEKLTCSISFSLERLNISSPKYPWLERKTSFSFAVRKLSPCLVWLIFN